VPASSAGIVCHRNLRDAVHDRRTALRFPSVRLSPTHSLGGKSAPNVRPSSACAQRSCGCGRVFPQLPRFRSRSCRSRRRCVRDARRRVGASASWSGRKRTERATQASGRLAEPTISNVPLPAKAIPPLTTAPASSTTKPPLIRSPLKVPPEEMTCEPAKMVLPLATPPDSTVSAPPEICALHRCRQRSRSRQRKRSSDRRGLQKKPPASHRWRRWCCWRCRLTPQSLCHR
jgi:hypothetical protein